MMLTNSAQQNLLTKINTYTTLLLNPDYEHWYIAKQHYLDFPLGFLPPPHDGRVLVLPNHHLHRLLRRLLRLRPLEHAEPLHNICRNKPSGFKSPSTATPSTKQAGSEASPDAEAAPSARFFFFLLFFFALALLLRFRFFSGPGGAASGVAGAGAAGCAPVRNRAMSPAKRLRSKRVPANSADERLGFSSMVGFGFAAAGETSSSS